VLRTVVSSFFFEWRQYKATAVVYYRSTRNRVCVCCPDGWTMVFRVTIITFAWLWLNEVTRTYCKRSKRSRQPLKRWSWECGMVERRLFPKRLVLMNRPKLRQWCCVCWCAFLLKVESRGLVHWNRTYGLFWNSFRGFAFLRFFFSQTTGSIRWQTTLIACWVSTLVAKY